LETLRADKNAIVDISPLVDLVELSSINLADNNITDIRPLVDNPGISGDDYLSVVWNPLDCDDPLTADAIETLTERLNNFNDTNNYTCD
jgi:Leucine-rich repeat (LRR) protein